ncbi:glycosyltransferase family 2 protein [Bacteroides fragilis]|jgi:glycosyltransferase involved in cell wall biosynthesis|uniref:glycosyltransferase family 2 protein n=1 Tax=Bacteroides TaxID=816 RepID=UPI001C383020|nr:glycosyltransferase family 2 protein [Bacteroides fragilis]MBV4192553.1 glycosyltransferase [Bacteroides fragilis]MCE8612378.1 glycosyltransferase [Bacteroides fragilis]MCM0275050.1 glycosyltransferase family 2 protein [Bacteroides fragilis]MCZ2616192.1 glycosyltransferase family 2 protein [Bacteroides fragilis]MCZ2623426.1 glycosyltransferase family 2 protein [Bacteroides fragilis]
MNALVTNPLVSIVIPVYNRELYIEDAIRSAISQTYQNIEIIIVDNCSTDSTWNILNTWARKDDRIKVFQNKENLGPVLNWNECFKRASGEYLKILWSDDWISPTFVEKCLSFFKRDTAFVLSGYQITTGDDTLLEVSYEKRDYTVIEYLNNILLYNKEAFPLSPGCAMFRTEDILSSFIVDIPNSDSLDSKQNGAGNDLLLFLNTAVNYTYISTVPGVDSYFRAHGGSFSIAGKLDLYYEWSKVFFIKKHLHKTLYEDIRKMYYLKKSITQKKYFKLACSLNFSSSFFEALLFIIKCNLQYNK